ncbi:hypothetical protein JHK87_008140 [Glycine soja]|nr:hypothetical protein JHK87_008140 [Glycine soja]
MLFVFPPVIRPDEQERFMAFLVNALPYIAWTMLAIFSLIRLQADYLLVVGVCLTLCISNVVGFTKCQKEFIVHMGIFLINFWAGVMGDIRPQLLWLGHDIQVKAVDATIPL